MTEGDLCSWEKLFFLFNQTIHAFIHVLNSLHVWKASVRISQGSQDKQPAENFIST